MADQTRTRNLIPVLSALYQALSPWMEPLLRFIAGAMLVPHGCQKLFGTLGGGGLAGTAQFMDRVGYHPGMLWAYVVGLNEVIAGAVRIVVAPKKGGRWQHLQDGFGPSASAPRVMALPSAGT
jgi:putative oxidoreductase